MRSKLVNPAPVHLPVLGIVVMLAGALINLIVSKFVKREAEKVNSVAMKSNALHLLTDVYTSLGVAASLLVVTVTEWYILDPIIGMVLAVYIIYEAFKLMKEAFPPLIDTRLSEEEEKTILKIIETFQQEFIEIHDFRTRRSGPQEYIDFHLVVASHVTIKDVHDLCDRIERDITNEFKQAQVMIHPEPESERKK